jgi:hypothetical protein
MRRWVLVSASYKEAQDSLLLVLLTTCLKWHLPHVPTLKLSLSFVINKYFVDRHRDSCLWFQPQEAESGRSWFTSSPGRKLVRALSQSVSQVCACDPRYAAGHRQEEHSLETDPIWKITKAKKSWSVAQMAEHLPSKHKGTAHQKQEKEKRIKLEKSCYLISGWLTKL